MVNHRIAEKLHQEGEKIALFFSNLPDLHMELLVYLDEQEWKIRDVLAHFISAEKSFQLLFENIRKDGKGTPDKFSINEFNNSQVKKMKEIETLSLLKIFIETRARTVEWVNGLSESELEKRGRHPAMGDATLAEMIKMLYLHNQMHLRDIKAAISAKEIGDLDFSTKEINEN